MKQGFSLRMSQHLALTPQLQQSIRLLQLSTLELSQEVEAMLDDNPFLELESDLAEREQFGLAQADERPVASEAQDIESAEAHDADAGDALDWEGDGSTDQAPDDAEWGGDAPALGASAWADGADDPGLAWASSSPSLAEHLHRQALALRLDALDRAILTTLIDSLNPDGYLEDALSELEQAMRDRLTSAQDPSAQGEFAEELSQRFRTALKLLQHMDPPGVGARDLSECLCLQVDAMASARGVDQQPVDPVLPVLKRLCALPLESLARRDFKRLALACDCSEAQAKAAMQWLRQLEPKPGRPFADVSRQIVVPDVLVTRHAGRDGPRFRVMLNPDVMPKLCVNERYVVMLKAHKASEPTVNSAMQQRLSDAKGFIKNIQQRFDTILRVSTAIVERQKQFLLHGAVAMRPLILKDIADELGLHESTISRVTTAKYMSTPQGTHELKYFFGPGLDTDAGGSASSTAVRALIRQLIEAESAKKPLSDQKLADLLKSQGIDCARRTVAKYREAMKIAPAQLRKVT